MATRPLELGSTPPSLTPVSGSIEDVNRAGTAGTTWETFAKLVSTPK